MAFTGDVLLHSAVWRAGAANARGSEREYDFTPMFAPIEPLISTVDWAVCHLEVNLSADNTRLSTYPVFKGPGAIAADLAAVGYDSCSTASNHSLDGRVAATFETLDVLDAAGLDHTGTARSPEERLETVWVDLNGIRIAHLAYTYWFNGFELPEEALWAANQIDEAQILSDAARARDEGAEFIMVSLHWGEQYRHPPDALQADLGPRLLASEHIDLIIGHHAHVVQPIEMIGDEWLVYGLGNLLHNQSQLPRRDELLVSLTVEEVTPGTFEVTELEVTPLFLDLATHTVWPSGPALRSEEIEPGLSAALDASWDRTLAVLETGSGWGQFTLGGD
jgi:poly-gamma-glutamate synthesis protein (capsule biosynthesis protein)